MSESSITTDPELLPNPTPGEILLEEFLRPLGLTQTALAAALRVPPRRINQIVLGKRAITADTDLRLTRLRRRDRRVTPIPIAHFPTPNKFSDRDRRAGLRDVRPREGLQLSARPRPGA
jgi:addiction module HigA family antidote